MLNVCVEHNITSTKALHVTFSHCTIAKLFNRYGIVAMYIYVHVYPCMTLCVDIACKVIYYGAG